MTTRVRPLVGNEGGQCDWGACSADAVAMRWSEPNGSDLPVCEMHTTDDGDDLHELLRRVDMACSQVCNRYGGMRVDLKKELREVARLARARYMGDPS